MTHSPQAVWSAFSKSPRRIFGVFSAISASENPDCPSGHPAGNQLRRARSIVSFSSSFRMSSVILVPRDYVGRPGPAILSSGGSSGKYLYAVSVCAPDITLSSDKSYSFFKNSSLNILTLGVGHSGRKTRFHVEDIMTSGMTSAIARGEGSETRMREISVTDIPAIRIGQADNAEAGTGCTVMICEAGMRAGLDVRGGGPASRESQLLNPLMAAQSIHAIVLAGGSAYGLGAANGVMTCLEERGIGYDTGFALVPLVAQADIYDLSVGRSDVRPDAAMGYEAARLALEAPNYRDGNYGAGCGASVGKIAGMGTAMKTGVGSYAVQLGDLKIGAIVVVNALGDIYDWKTGAQVAGLLTEDRTALRSTMEYMRSSVQVVENKFTGNTTLAVVITNAAFDKAQLCKAAGMAHDGYARSINPVHTSADGDSIYAVSVGDVRADQDLVGALSAEVVSEAILRAVESAESAYGLLAARDLRKNR